jgi:RecB family exonuclease
MQRRSLVRTRDLRAFRAALAQLALEGSPLDARRRAILVPTRAAAELLRQTIEQRARATRAALVWPDIVTRRELLERLGAAVPGAPRMLTRAEREVLMGRAATRTAQRPAMQGAPFALRPGLVAAMLDFYDELRRRQGAVRRLAGELFDQLRVERGTDRGSESLIHQTSFLGFAFLAYDRAARASGGADEHLLRDRLIEAQPTLPYDHIVITGADDPADPLGVWPADFDCYGRLQALGRIDVVVTDGVHDAGFRARVERELPGIEETRVEASGAYPVLVTPPARDGSSEALAFLSRDREDELRDIARDIRARAAATAHELRDRVGIVFARPLPYLYLAGQVLSEARVPYRAFGALPLASEPYAALVDVVMTAARAGGTREAAIELLRSRLLRFTVDGEPVTGADASALDLVLTERRVVTGAASFPDAVAAYSRGPGHRRQDLAAGALRAARAAAAALDDLRGVVAAPTTAERIRTIGRFIQSRERAGSSDVETEAGARFSRARAAVLAALDDLADAHERHGGNDAAEDPASIVRHALESHVFLPRHGTGGVHLVDSAAARFAEFDHAYIVGLVETDWPSRTRPNLFYSTNLLAPLGWPGEHDRSAAERATFVDLLGSAAQSVRLSAFLLEGDAIVGLTSLLEAASEAPARAPTVAASRPPLIFDDEVFTGDDEPRGLPPDVGAWLSARRGRGDLTDRRFSGSVGPRPATRYRVSRVDRYVDCPFKYFAENVLGLPEERDEAAGLTPLERGTLVHQLFEEFFRSWVADPGGAITAERLPDALARFAALTDRTLAALPEADRALERSRLLGSIVAPGIADRVFELEVDAGDAIVKRLLETDLRGPFAFPQLGGLKSRVVEIAGKADRIDILANRRLRVIDYKLSRLPDTKASIQIAVYAHAAKLLLEQTEGQPYEIADAMYLAFGDEDKFAGGLATRDAKAADAVHARVQTFADIIDRIEAGEYPPSPRHLSDCSWCRYAGVCRKEYRTEADEAAEPV